MGQSTVRITAEAFVTPPEFHGLQLATRSAGQIGGVRLELIQCGDKTQFGHCYQQVPLRVLPPFNFSGEPAGLLYLLNPTAGLLDGDGQRIEIRTAAGVKAVVTGQSATRIHPCPQNFSTQQWRIHVAPDSELVVLPGPAIPFHGARSYQRVEVDLAPGARFIWADIWYPGRYARGELSERFQFRSLIQELEVRRHDDLVYRDRFHWQGPWDDEDIHWHLGGHLACGHLFVSGGVDEQRLDGGSGVETALMPLASGDTCIRCCGSPADVMHKVVCTALHLAGSWSGRPAAGPWLLSTHGLAKNHWFSTSPN